ncbi:MAG: polysaccharide biosynthesis C-terminal domain-containing protein [Parafilimonas sp.]
MGFKKLLTQSITWRGFYFFSVLLVNIFLSRYLQAAQTGLLYFVTVIFSFMQVALGLGGEAGIIYFASANVIERNKLISVGATWSLIAGIIMIGLVYVYFLFDKQPEQFSYKWYCMFGFLYVFGQLLTNFSVAIFYTKEKYFLPNFLLAAVNILFVLIIPNKSAVKSTTQIEWITLLYFATFLAGGLCVFFAYIFQYKNESAFGFPDRMQSKKFIRYAATAFGANILFFMVYKIDYFFVNLSHASTAADLGNYIQVSKLGQLFLLVPQIIASVVFPKTATGGVDRMKINNAIIVMARLFSQLYLVAFIVTALIGNKLFVGIFGESFNKMQVPMLIIIPGIFTLSVSALLSAYFSGKGNVKVNLYSAIIALTVMLLGDYFFVLPYGIIAAAIVSTLSYLIDLIYLLFQFYKDYSISWVEFVRWERNDYKILLSLLKRNAD